MSEPELRNAQAPLDIVYLFRHSKHGDQELRYSLRSVAANLPYIRKVWIFGDLPKFISSDTSIVEHVPHAYVAPLLGYRVPVRNDFLLLVLGSMIPGVAFDFLRFSDDYVILRPVSRERLCTPRAVEDLSEVTTRGEGKWKTLLWQTYDVLKRYGYSGVNFESHTPQPLNRKLVFEAFMAFRPFLSEERYNGLQSSTSVFNYAIKHYGQRFTWLSEDHSRAGFYESCPNASDIAAACEGKSFLNFDDGAFGPTMIQFLGELLPQPCKFER